MMFVAVTVAFLFNAIVVDAQGAVSSLKLLKAGKGGAVIATLVNGTSVTLNETKAAFAVVAETSGTISLVDFSLNGVKVRTETKAPYAMCANTGNDFKVCDKLQLGTHTVTASPKGGSPYTVTFDIVDAIGALALSTRNMVQLGPRPYFLVKAMKESPLKQKLAQCAKDMKLFQLSDFAIGHRGACLQFPEHTESSYEAASQLGAGIVECDVTFTKDLELVCRHAQCDMHTTTDVVTRPELNAKCRVPWAPGIRPTCCTSDFTLAEVKTLCAKMDSSFNANSLTARGYAFGGTADWRTDLYQTGCPAVPTHKESIEIIQRNGGKFTPELKAPEVTMPFNGFSQDNFVAKLVKEFEDAKVPPENVWIQSATFSDMVYLTKNTAYGKQAVALDFEDSRTAANDQAWIDNLKNNGVKILAPPTYKLVAANPSAGQAGQKDFVASEFAKKIKASGLDIITWTLSRTGPPLDKPTPTDYYWSSLQGKNLGLTEGSNFDLLDVFYQDVGILGIFDDWPAVTAFYANCVGIKLRKN